MAMKVAGGEGPWCAAGRKGAGDAPSQLPM